MSRNTASEMMIKNSIIVGQNNISKVGVSVDLAIFTDVSIALTVGNIADGIHTFKVQHSEDNTTFIDVDSSMVTNQFEVVTVDSSNRNQLVGYIGNKRYLRVVSDVVGGVKGGAYGVQIILSEPTIKPVPDYLKS